MFKLKKLPLLMGLSLTLTANLAFNTAIAEDDAAEADDEVEEVVVIGSRRDARSATESPAPIDVVSSEDFINQGDTDLSNLLRNVVPSYNVNTQPISDAATIVRPANLRGLAPDHTLVLINGKRRHRAAVIYWLGNGVADGAQGPDISVIPSIALKQVEVLRDGASAQYGSDAIAGVMNFVLKDDTEGGSMELKYGQFFEGDGAATTLSGNFGMPFSDNGFANVSFEFAEADDTDRSVQRNDAQAIIDAGNTDVANPAQIWGQPKIIGDTKLFLNMGLDLGDGKEWYAFGNYAQKEVNGGFYFRNPHTRGGVFSNDDGATLLVGDVLDAQDGILDGSANCPTITITNNVPDPVALLAVQNNPNCFVFNEVFPGGFTPRFGGHVNDFAITSGVRGEMDNGWNWDLSAAVGRNEVDFYIRNTVNASLGPQSPTEFDPGAYTQLDKNFNFDMSKEMEWGNLAFGTEYREEQFEITTGDQASFEIGPYAAQGFSSASNGFPGFSPLASGSWDRANYALYGDLEWDVNDSLLLGFAARFEDFDDFGTTTNFKVSGHYRVNDELAFRTTYSTGFRAPTPGQSNAFNVSTEFEAGELVNNGTIPSTNPIAQLRGGVPLEPEESKNATFGVVFSIGEVDVTIDYFDIELTDRISLSQNFMLNPSEVQALIDSGVTSAANLRNFRFFTNSFDTSTSGVDIIATWGTELFNGDTDFSFAFNDTQTNVDDFDPTVINATRIAELEAGLPETRWNISMNQQWDQWRWLTRISYYDDFFDSEDGRVYGDEYIMDMEVAYQYDEDWSFVLGAQNILDEFPDENPDAAAGVGNQYSQFAPTGFGGGFYYLRVKKEF